MHAMQNMQNMQNMGFGSKMESMERTCHLSDAGNFGTKSEADGPDGHDAAARTSLHAMHGSTACALPNNGAAKRPKQPDLNGYI